MPKLNEQVSESPVDAQPVVIDNQVDEIFEEITFDSLLSDITSNIANMYGTIKSVKDKMRTLERQHKRELKYSRKYRRAIANSSEKEAKKPSGFNKPCPVPAEIIELLKLDPSAEKSRTEITKLIYGYIKEHNLQDPNDKRNINPDTELQKLFKLDKKEQISFYNIQTHIKKVYPDKSLTDASSSVQVSDVPAVVAAQAVVDVPVATVVAAAVDAALDAVVATKAPKSKKNKKATSATAVAAA
jgi:chromatin remodeling complex protein RSC6